MSRYIEMLRGLQEVIDDMSEHLPEGAYLKSMNDLRDLFHFVETHDRQLQQRAMLERRRQEEEANRRAIAAIQQAEREARQAQPQPQPVVPVPAPQPQPAERRARRDRRRLDLPQDTPLQIAQANLGVAFGRWDATRHVIIDRQDRIWHSPTSWADSLGGHVNGWDYVRIDGDVRIGALTLTNPTIGRVYDLQHQ